MRRPETRRLLAAAAVAMLLAGCATPMPRLQPSLVDELLALQQMNSEALLAAEARLAQADGPRERLLRAALRSAPAHPLRDVAAARLALEREAISAERERDQAAPGWRDLASLLALWLAEQDRADAVQQQQLADERRLAQLDARTRDLERRLLEAEKRTLDAERRAQEAQRKLEALRAIEKEMSGRTPEAR
jgi:hypothetical protein